MMCLETWNFWLSEGKSREPLCAPLLLETLSIPESLFWPWSAWGCAPYWFLLGDWGYSQGHQLFLGIDSQPLLVYHARCVWSGWGLLPLVMCTWKHNFGGGFCALLLAFGFFLLKWYPAKEEWDLLKVREGVLFIDASPTPSTVHGTLVRNCFF